MRKFPQNDDLHLFRLVIKEGSFAKTAEAIGFSPAYVTKRIQRLEENLGATLLYRSNQHLQLTPIGEEIYHWAGEVLAQLESMREAIMDHQNEPVGDLRITCSLGFGRRYIAPLLGELQQRYPQLRIEFDTTYQVEDLIDQQIDLDIHIGNDLAPHLIAKRLAANRRILVASPNYIAQYGAPATLDDLHHHRCLVIKERDHPNGLWRLQSTTGDQSIRVEGHLISNNGEIVRDWALGGEGIALRSEWDIGEAVAKGDLIHLLPNYWQDADIWALYNTRLAHSAKLRKTVEFLGERLVLRG